MGEVSTVTLSLAAIFFLMTAALLFYMRTRDLRHLLEEARREKMIAEDRLFYAVRDEHVIPLTRDAVLPPIPVHEEPPVPIPTGLRELVDRWEDEESRAKAEAEIRAFLKAGRSEASIWRHYESD